MNEMKKEMETLIEDSRFNLVDYTLYYSEILDWCVDENECRFIVRLNHFFNEQIPEGEERIVAVVFEDWDEIVLNTVRARGGRAEDGFNKFYKDKFPIILSIGVSQEGAGWSFLFFFDMFDHLTLLTKTLPKCYEMNEYSPSGERFRCADALCKTWENSEGDTFKYSLNITKKTE